jgi:hypothetical protein
MKKGGPACLMPNANYLAAAAFFAFFDFLAFFAFFAFGAAASVLAASGAAGAACAKAAASEQTSDQSGDQFSFLRPSIQHVRDVRQTMIRANHCQ